MQDWLNRRGKAVAPRLVRWTGQHPAALHPKHLSGAPWHTWYLDALGPEDVVLDAGCAQGAHLVQVARRCQAVTGVEVAWASVEQARGAIRATGLRNAQVVWGDLTQALPFQDGAFTAVLFLDVLEHLAPRQAVLRELRRVLTPDGRLLVSAPNRDTRWRRALRAAKLFAYADPEHQIEYTREEFVAELAAAGFVVETLTPVVLDTPWAGCIDAVGGLAPSLYRRLSEWKRQAALRAPQESTGFRAVARPAAERCGD